jgi:hypothetical protein
MNCEYPQVQWPEGAEVPDLEGDNLAHAPEKWRPSGDETDNWEFVVTV